MSIDEKIKNNWYLEQDEIQTLINRYTIMKKLIILFISILTVFLITSCGSTGPEPEQGFEPYRIGDFLMVSPTRAELQDDHLKQAPPTTSGDTLFVTSLDQMGLHVEKDTDYPERNYTRLGITDSTLKTATNDGYMTGTDYFSQEGFDHRGYYGTADPEFLRYGFYYTYTCGTVLENQYTARFSFYNSDSTHVRTWVFEFTGLNEVLEDVNNCPT